jgi:hypothetical protein
MIGKENLKIIAMVIAGLMGVLVLNIVISILAIWAVNTLFGMQIRLTIETTIAAIVLIVIFGPGNQKKTWATTEA